MYPQVVEVCADDGTRLELTDTGSPLIGSRLNNRYVVVRQIGAGAMGAVYEGVEIATQRRVALKVVHQNADVRRKDIERLRMEARAVSSIDHPNVVKFLDFGQSEAQVQYIVMELMRGRSLSRELKKVGRPLAIDRATWIVCQAAEGVAAAHRQGLIHRDLKPGNIYLLDEKDAAGRDRVKVLDFGLVAGPNRLDAGLTATGVVLGTPHFISPEQVAHPPVVTKAADVYALGILLFELVVGHRPFDGETFFAVIDAHLTKPVPRPLRSDTGVKIPAAVRRVWLRALDKDPAKRFRDAGALSKALFSAAFGSVMNAVATRPAGPRQVGAQRKLVTVLTTHVTDGGVSLPAPMHAALAIALGEVLGIVGRHGGAGEVLPDGRLCAHFGLAGAREDDALSALKAALLARTRLLQEFPEDWLEVGLHTRFVLAAPGDQGVLQLVDTPWDVVSAVAREGRMHGSVAVSGATFRTLRRHIRASSPAVSHVAGESIHLLAAVGGVNDATHPDVEAGPPIGRDAELSTMRGWVNDAMRLRQLRYCLVSGAVGVGKSRLGVELTRWAAQSHPGLTVLSAQPDAQETAPFNLFERLLSNVLGVSGGDLAGPVVAWLQETLQSVAIDDARRDADEILRLIGLQTATPGAPPQLERQRGFEAFAHLFRALAAQGGVLLHVDDAQHIDAGSQDLLAYLGRELLDFPAVIVVLTRPDSAVEERYMEAAGDPKSPLIPAALSLAPLQRAASQKLATRLAKGTRISSQNLEKLVARADGNPLFLEEMLRAPGGGGRWSARLPDSIRAVIGARIDGLSEPERVVLQAASVVGREFWMGAVCAQPAVERLGPAVDRTLIRLERLGYITRKVETWEGEVGWRFQSQMTQEVCYQLNVPADIKTGHRAVADWLAARPGATPHALVGMHLDRAGERDGAADAYCAAGDAATARFANKQAASAYSRALTLQRSWESQQTDRVQLELAICLQHMGDRVKASELLESLVRRDDVTATLRARALRYKGRAAAWEGDINKQMELLNQATRAGAEAELPERLFVAADLAYALVRHGQVGKARKIIDGAMGAAYQADRLGPVLLPLAQLHQSESMWARNQGRLKEAEASARSAIELYDQLGYSLGVATTRTSLSALLRDMARFDEAVQVASEAAETFKRLGYPVHELSAWVNLGWSQLEAGRAEPALHLFRRLPAEFSESFTTTERVLVTAGAALSARLAGEAAEAEARARECLEAGQGATLGEVRGWALYGAGVVLNDSALLEDSAACWRMLERPSWLARTLDALAQLKQEPVRSVMLEEARTLRETLRR